MADISEFDPLAIQSDLIASNELIPSNGNLYSNNSTSKLAGIHEANLEYSKDLSTSEHVVSSTDFVPVPGRSTSDLTEFIRGSAVICGRTRESTKPVRPPPPPPSKIRSASYNNLPVLDEDTQLNSIARISQIQRWDRHTSGFSDSLFTLLHANVHPALILSIHVSGDWCLEYLYIRIWIQYLFSDWLHRFKVGLFLSNRPTRIFAFG